MKGTGKIVTLLLVTALGLGGGLAVSSCYRTQLIDAGGSAAEKPAAVPYRVAERYFVRNDFTSYGTFAIRDKAAFDRMFGAAAVMGKDGLPTPIDFSREAVLAVVSEPVNVETEIKPVRLVRGVAGETIVTYCKKTRRRNLSYTVAPALLLVVEKDAAARVKWVEQGK